MGIGGVFTTFGFRQTNPSHLGEMPGSGASSASGVSKRTASSEPFNEPKKSKNEGGWQMRAGGRQRDSQMSDELMRDEEG